MNLTEYLKAGYPFLAIETFEIKRAVNVIEIDEPFKKLKWNMIDGLNIEEGENYKDFEELMNFLKNHEKLIVCMENLNMLLNADNPSETLIQILLNNTELLKHKQICLCIIGTDIKFPSCLEKLITIIDFELPTKEEFREIAKSFAKQMEIEYNEVAADACAGFSLEEGENALALSIIKNKKLDKNTILEMKKHSIKSTGFMDYMEPEPIENFGGYDNLKDYIKRRLKAWEPNSKAPKIKSIMLCGISGAGKSLFTKVLASIMNWPLISLDVGALKGGLVGETEKHWRKATKLIDAAGKCIVRLDEVEKMFAGGASDIQTNSVDAGQLGYFLSWSQDRTSEGILVATCNNINQLPPEFMRRWDASFFVDFPGFNERKEIISIMNKKHFANLPIDNKFIEKLEGWTGAEIENLAKESHFYSVEEALTRVPLIKKIKEKEIKEMTKYKAMMQIANSIEEKKQVLTRTLNNGESMLDESTKLSIKEKLAQMKAKRKGE